MADRGAIEAGKAVMSLSVDKPGFANSLRDTGKMFVDWGKGIAKAGGIFAGLGAAIQAPLTLAAKAFADFGSPLKDLSVKSGISAENLSKLSFAAEQAGTSLGTVESGISSMGTLLEKAATGSKKATKTLDSLGLSMKDLDGKSASRQFEILAKAVSEISDPLEKSETAVMVFGSAGNALLPLLGNLDQAKARAEALGFVMSGEDATAAKDLSNSLGTLSYAFSFMRSTIGSAVAGPLREYTEWTINAVGAANKWISQNKGFISVAFQVGGVLTGIGVALGTIGGVLAATGLAFGGIASGVTTAAAAIGGALTFLLSPIGLLSAAIIGGAGAWLYYTGLAGQAASGISSALNTLLGDWRKTWSGISAALAKGDLPGAIGAGWAFIKQQFSNGTALIQSAWSAFWGQAVATAVAVWEGIKGPVTAAWSWLASTWESIVSALEGTWGGFGTILRGGWATQVGSIFNTIGTRAQAVLDYIGAGFRTVGKDASGALSGIAKALSAGNITVAAKVLWAFLKLEWAQGVGALESLWDTFQPYFLEIAGGAFSGLLELGTTAWAALQTGWVEMVSTLGNVWDTFAGTIEKRWNTTIGNIKLKLATLNPLTTEKELLKIGLDVVKQNSEVDKRTKGSIADRNAGRDASTAAIEQQRVDSNAAINAKIDAFVAANSTAGGDGNAAGIAAARGQYEAALAEAANLTKKTRPKGGTDELPSFGELQETKDKITASGTFNAAAVQGLGGGGVAEQQLLTQKQIVQLHQQTNELLRNKRGQFTFG